MGLSYSELSDIGRLRKKDHCGPYTIFVKLLELWRNKYTPKEVGMGEREMGREVDSEESEMERRERERWRKRRERERREREKREREEKTWKVEGKREREREYLSIQEL